jgi:hypothetical protein
MPQKNSGAKASKRVSPVETKNTKFIQSFMEDVKKETDIGFVFVGRVIKKLGNGRVEVVYQGKGGFKIAQAVIRGSFRGKAKRSMWIEVGSIVIIADSGVAGTAEFSVMALLSDDEVRDVRNTMDLSPRIFDISEVDSDSLLSNKPNLEAIIEFGEEEVNVDDV